MAFSSIKFLLIFLPIFLIIYYAVPQRAKNLILFAGSIVFYSFGDKISLIFIFISLLINFSLGKIIGKIKEKTFSKKLALFIGIIFNFGALIYFKYYNFIADNISLLTHTKIEHTDVTMPLGISFFTFTVVSYLVDVYRREVKYSPNVITFSTYIIMFPKMLMGPITKYGEVRKDLLVRHQNIEDLEEGLKIFTLGLGYKVILSDNIATLWAGTSRFGYDSMSTPFAWLGAFAFSFNIYFDFWGYSLMAMGISRMLGFHIPKNFDNPYISSSMGEFWRRWHITLGRWFKEYIYFPLGGSRCSNIKILRNTFIVWAFTGLWHGASWNFVLWGLSFFVFLTLERYVYGKALAKTHILKHLYVTAFIPVTWIIFAIGDIKEMGLYFSRMFPFFGTPDYVTSADFTNAVKNYWPMLLACVVFSLPFPEKFIKKHSKNFFVMILLAAVFVYSIYRIEISSSNPFMYLNF